MSGLRSAALGVFVGVGSRDEAPPVGGVSHFIEHLLFRGSDVHTALEIAQIFDRFGAELNAATSREFTEIYARVIDSHVDAALQRRRRHGAGATWADLDAEREVVLEEIAMYDDAPDDLVHDLIGEVVFPGDALGRPVIGTADDHRRADAGRRWRRTTRPTTAASNIVVSAAGSVDHDALVALVDRELGSVPAGQLPPRSSVNGRSPPGRAVPGARHRAVPPLPRRARRVAARRPPVRDQPARPAARRRRLVAPVPGDPRAARHGVRRLHVRLALPRDRATSASTSAPAARTSRSA